MTEELRKFMYEDTLKSVRVLMQNIGQKVSVRFNKSMNDNLPPVQAQINGVLTDVNGLKNIVIGKGTIIDFVSPRHIISEILSDAGKILYDKTLVVNKMTQVKNNLPKYREAILGVTNEHTRSQAFTKSLN